MGVHPTLSGKDVIRILTKKFDFQIISQKGSHVKLRKYTEIGKITTIVPNHDELDIGTLEGILDLAQIKKEDFWNAYR
ncbi:MAG: type II toxin-antitoxin system HicA family toxin [Candidatus Desantisbacteria bacterium]